MDRIWAERALLADGWASDVCVTISPTGRIAEVERGVAPTGARRGVLLHAPANCHSHAFQRAMAGLTEKRGDDPSDSFWTWRRLMYRFLDQLTPDHVQAVAALVQMEMLEAGYATNVEFHYLHHRPDGLPYDRLAEMSDRIAAASCESGIGLSLLPVLYQYGGCDQRPLGPGQRRFGNDIDQFARLLSEAGAAVSNLPADARIGIAPHSLRAVGRDGLRDVVPLCPEGPIHMHLAEQIPEVDEVQAAWGARPVDWALENLPIDDRWCLIHLTQMTPDETVALAKTGAVAGLCPITESNLGDGIFDGVRWMNAGGHIALGSDSDILISLAEEMRVLDHSQRLRDHSRAALAATGVSTGRRIFDAVCTGGARAAGRGAGLIEVGEWADLLMLESGHIDLCGLTGDTVLDTFVVSGGKEMITDVWSAGRHLVRDGRHINRDNIIATYRDLILPLRQGL